MKQLFCILFFLSFYPVFSQDTTWVQTFTFDSISTRRANFVFPQELNNKRFEKVLMYYKLKCSPLTPWDQYNCGEWDYLTYTRIFEHTGVLDSIKKTNSQYLTNYNAPLSYTYFNAPFSKFNYYQTLEKSRVASGLTHTIVDNSVASNHAFPFAVNDLGSTYQCLFTANELITAGILPGDIQSLQLFISNIVNTGDVNKPKISIKATTNAQLNGLVNTGFTEVYNQSRVGLNSLQSGPNDFIFHTPFTWNGTDHLILEFTFNQSQIPVNQILFDQTAITEHSFGFQGKNGVLKFANGNTAMLELSDFTLGNEMTLMFWAKGNGNTGVNTSVLEAYDTLNRRMINIHMPWSDNTMYFDAGNNTGYDRIQKSMSGAGIDNEWHHWAFVKNANTGVMEIYRDGVLWHNGTGKNKNIGYISRLQLGSNWNRSYDWNGKLDEFQLFNKALDAATISSWRYKKIDNSHPQFANLLAYYRFDNLSNAVDEFNANLLMPSDYGMLTFDEKPFVGLDSTLTRPKISFGQGLVVTPASNEYFYDKRTKEAQVTFELSAVNQHFEINNAFLGLPSGSEDTLQMNGTILGSMPFTGNQMYSNDTIFYHEPPYEIVNDIEIGRYITPYGINFDLGPNGFYWLYDVTDYQQYLKDTVDLAAHNTQELLDLKFAFIEGIPPRDVHKREPIWQNWKTYSYKDMDNDTVLKAKSIVLSDTSEMFKIKTRFTGHGHYGSTNCCEWDPKDHKISIDGVERFNWSIWQTNECGDNPNIGQGGTWPYAREGWCPGDMVKEHDHEITPFVTPGQAVTIDYDIESVPTFDLDQGNGNYVVAMDLISYSKPNHQVDAAIVDILNPNKWEYYSKWNPTCSNPRIILQNTGEQPLTSCKIRCWVSYGDWLEYEWHGNLGFLEKEIVEIPVTDLSWWQDYAGTQIFTAQLYDVNGFPSLDEYAKNDVKKVKFDAPEGITGAFYVHFKTNNRASENKYRLIDASGNIIFERNSLQNNLEYKDTFNLDPGCYSIIVEDTDHDGLGFWYSNQVEGETYGWIRLRKVGGNYFEFFPTDFGRYHRYDFSVGFGLGTADEVLEPRIDLFPNPASDQVKIELNGEVGAYASLEIIDLSGQLMYTSTMSTNSTFAEKWVDVSFLAKGNYLIKIQTEKGVYTEKMIKL